MFLPHERCGSTYPNHIRVMRPVLAGIFHRGKKQQLFISDRRTGVFEKGLRKLLKVWILPAKGDLGVLSALKEDTAATM